MMKREMREDSRVVRMIERIADLFFLNILVVLFSLPIVTGGAALVAMHCVLLKMARGEEGYVFHDFWFSFRGNFKQATCLWLMILAIILPGLGELLIYRYEQSIFPLPLITVITVVISLTFLFIQFIFPVQSHFANSLMGTLRTALILSVAYFPVTLTMALLNIIPVLLFFWGALLALPLLALFGISFPGFLCVKFYAPIFQKIEEGASHPDLPE